MSVKDIGNWDAQTTTWDSNTYNWDATVSVTTKNYGLAKPVVGGSENEWGGILNRDIDAIDALLGGDLPVYGINIQSGMINAGAIVGTIDGVTVNGLEVNGTIGSLNGGAITGSDIYARTFICEQAITASQYRIAPASAVLVQSSNGGIQLLESLGDTQNIHVVMSKGQRVSLWCYVRTGQTPIINWTAESAQMLWADGEPTLREGHNIIELTCVHLSSGPAVFGDHR